MVHRPFYAGNNVTPPATTSRTEDFYCVQICLGGNTDNTYIIIQRSYNTGYMRSVPVVIVSTAGTGNIGDITVYLQVRVLEVYSTINNSYLDSGTSIIRMDYFGIDTVYTPG